MQDVFIRPCCIHAELVAGLQICPGFDPDRAIAPSNHVGHRVCGWMQQGLMLESSFAVAQLVWNSGRWTRWSRRVKKGSFARQLLQDGADYATLTPSRQSGDAASKRTCHEGNLLEF